MAAPESVKAHSSHSGFPHGVAGLCGNIKTQTLSARPDVSRGRVQKQASVRSTVTPSKEPISPPLQGCSPWPSIRSPSHEGLRKSPHILLSIPKSICRQNTTTVLPPTPKTHREKPTQGTIRSTFWHWRKFRLGPEHTFQELCKQHAESESLFKNLSVKSI